VRNVVFNPARSFCGLSFAPVQYRAPPPTWWWRPPGAVDHERWWRRRVDARSRTIKIWSPAADAA